MGRPKLSAGREKARMPQGRRIETILDIGEAVRSERLRQGLTQADAAGLLGVGTRFLSELERGKPTLEVALVLKTLHGLGFFVQLEPRHGAP